MDIKGHRGRNLCPLPVPGITGPKSGGQTSPTLLQTPATVHNRRVTSGLGLHTVRLGLPPCSYQEFPATAAPILTEHPTDEHPGFPTLSTNLILNRGLSW